MKADTLANLTAFGVMAVAGVALNLLIMALSGEASLGVFNQVYAVYVVASQLAVLGIHDAVHREVAAHSDAPERQRASLAAGLKAVVPSGVAVGFALVAGGPLLGLVAGSAAVGAGVQLLGPAVFLFVVNKVLMSALAGQQRLQPFAAVQIVRISVLFGVTAWVAATGRPSAQLAWGFGAAELAILPILWGLLGPRLGLGGRDHMRRHWAFGTKALAHGFIAESFLRVDILMLAPFVDDAAIGVYSLAAMFAEGLYQIGGTVRNVVAPRMVPLLAPDADPGARRRLIRQALALGLGAFALVAGTLAVGFPVLGWALDPELVAQAHGVLLVLMVGLGVNAAFLPMDGLLLWAGHPGRQSAMMAANIVVNVALNLALVPVYGIAGAAVATALAWGFSALSLQAAAWLWLGMRGGVVGEAWGPRAR